MKKVRLYVKWVDGREETADIPVSLLGQVIPAIYEHPAIWRIVYKTKTDFFPTYREFREVYGGVLLPHIDDIESRRYNADMEYLAKEIDAIGKNR